MTIEKIFLNSKKEMEKRKLFEINQYYYQLYLLELKYNSISIIKKVIKKYIKKEYQYIIFDSYKNTECFELDGSFILHNKYLNVQYKKYKYIFIDLKNINNRRFIYFYKKEYNINNK